MTTKDLNIQEFNPHYAQYLDKIPKDDKLIPLLERLKIEFIDFLDLLNPDSLTHRYSNEKWSVSQVLQHMIDTERIFQFRALIFARQDKNNLAGFDQDNYVKVSEIENRTISDYKEEFTSVRNAGISLFKSFSEEMLQNKGIASNSPLSVRAAGFIIAGHQIHHRELFKNLYQL